MCEPLAREVRAFGAQTTLGGPMVRVPLGLALTGAIRWYNGIQGASERGWQLGSATAASADGESTDDASSRKCYRGL